jgi:TPR repeat protein
MFQPNRPQWVTIVVTFVFATISVIDSDGSGTVAFFVIAGALIVWWLEGRRQKRDELQQRTRRPTEAGAETEDRDHLSWLTADDIDTDKYKASLTLYRNEAESSQGNPNAQSLLGAAYHVGKGVPQDAVESIRWFRLAADQGVEGAQCQLGAAYRVGKGVPQDYVESVRWFRLAADQGFADAQRLLGSAYYFGEGVPQDHAQTVTWYRKAAEQGDADAQFNLGMMYADGRGVLQDYVEAHKWRNLAASRASAENQKQYAETRDALATLMTPAQLADAQKLAREWQAAFDARQE